nr:hypothetical protein B0A51_01711 [Rachicladosporium sp. CCFEE 5018]
MDITRASQLTGVTMGTPSAISGNVMSAPSLSSFMSASLPKDASPQLETAYDAIALASHAALLATGFRLVGLGEEHRLDVSADSMQPHILPSEWNSHAGSYAFRYKHSQSSMEYLLKVNRMGNKAVIMGMGMGDDKTHTFDVKISEFISEGNLPASPARHAGSNEEDLLERLGAIFITVGRLSDFGSLFRLNIIQKLIPSLQKEGYQETPSGQSSSAQTNEPRQPRQPRGAERPDFDPFGDGPVPRPHPLADPLAQPRRPLPEPMPGFDDDFEMQRPFRGGLPGGGFPRIGDRDLYPQGLGPNDGMRGGVGPGLGGMGGGGMHPTFDDPLFAGQGQRGGGFDPQAPPGARFDPIGPGNRGGHPRGAGMGGRPPNPFGGFGGNDFI